MIMVANLYLFVKKYISHISNVHNLQFSRSQFKLADLYNTYLLVTPIYSVAEQWK